MIKTVSIRIFIYCIYWISIHSNNFYFNHENQLNQLQLIFGVEGFTFSTSFRQNSSKVSNDSGIVRNTFLHFSGITPPRDKNESLRIFPAAGMEGRDTRLINVQWRRRYTRISRLNTSGRVERRITRVPYAGVKFREIKNSEIYPLARYTRGPRGGRLLAWRTTVSFHPFRIFSFSFGAWQFGGRSYCAYLSRMEENSGKNRKFEVPFGLFWNTNKVICEIHKLKIYRNKK